MYTAGFVGAASVGRPLTAQFAQSSAQRPRLSARSARASSRAVVMTVTPDAPGEESVSLSDSSASASEILADMRTTAAAKGEVNVRNTGASRDVDGKSNVWAVEPAEQVDDGPEVNKAAILGAVFAAIVFALAVLPRLPFVNADQF